MVSNKVQGEDGRWRTLDSRRLHRAMVALSASYTARTAVQRITGCGSRRVGVRGPGECLLRLIRAERPRGRQYAKWICARWWVGVSISSRTARAKSAPLIADFPSWSNSATSPETR